MHGARFGKIGTEVGTPSPLDLLESACCRENVRRKIPHAGFAAAQDDKIQNESLARLACKSQVRVASVLDERPILL